MKFIVNHNMTQVIGDKEEILDLQKLLSFKIEGGEYSNLYKRGLWDGYHHFLFKRFNKTLKLHEHLFRTGLLTYILKHYDWIDINDIRKYTLNSDLKYLDNLNLRDKEGVSQLKGIKLALKNKIGIWHCATNFGKSRMAIGLLKVLSYSNKVDTAIFTHSDLIKNQLLKDLRKYCNKKNIGEISSGVFNPKLITVCMMPTIARAMKNNLKEYFGYLLKLKAYIADECHRGSSDTFLKPMDFCVNAEIRIGMSGTPLYKNVLNNLKLIERVGDVIYTVKNKTLIKEGISAKPTIIISKINGNYKYPSEYLTWPLKKKKYIYAVDSWIINNDNLIIKIIDDIKTEIKRNSDILIVVNRKVQANNIMIKLLDNKIKSLYLDGSVKNREDVLDDFKSKKHNILISLPVMDEGVDINNIKALILAGGGKSNRQLLQRIGRSIRKKVTGENEVRIYDYSIKDERAKSNGTRYLYDHFKERLKVYKKEKFKIIYN